MMSSSPSNGESEAKRICDMKTIGTHSGHFHCDEALACYMLKLLPEYKDARYMYIHIHTCTCMFNDYVSSPLSHTKINDYK